jgi:RHS repeat-associated protein
MAVQETIVSVGGVRTADVTLTYSVYDQYCYPAGVRLVVSGSENWGATGKGVVKLSFNKPAISVSGDTAYFGNSSGVALGFDWSDSASMGPSYNVTSSVLSYLVGPTFAIDPSTIGGSGASATSTDYQGQVMVANGLYWAFFGTSTEAYATSPDGLNWTVQGVLTTGCTAGNGRIAFYLSGATLYYVIQKAGKICYRYGTLNSGGTITWSIAEGTFTATNNGGSDEYLSTTLDSTGKWWVAIPTLGGTGYHQEVWVCATPSSCSWTKSLDWVFPPNWEADGKLTALTNGRLSLVVTNTTSALRIATYSGSAWSLPASTSSVFYTMAQSSCLAIGDVTECLVSNLVSGSVHNVVYLTASYHGNSPVWSTPETLYNCGASTPYASLSTDGISTLVAGYVCSGSKGVMYYQVSTDGGLDWSSVNQIATSSNPKWLTMSFGIQGGLFEAMWITGTSSSGYYVNFIPAPVDIPTAASTTTSWSRPGLSPYESYFSSFSEYVSPGNGLLTVEVGTLDLPGRALDFAPALVFSTPYAFRTSGSPYEYDNFTASNLGNGWSLNLPWVGTNYLHLTDGQAIPYAWSNGVFEDHGQTDFKLVDNVTKGIYTLYLASGTTWKFDSKGRPTSETDRTKASTISFAYGSNGYISQVTDTIGRIITFSYTGSQLTSITEGSRTWTLGYTGNQLTSLTDPLSRVTSFQYVGTTGANAWLLSAIIWPTGGKATYSYGTANVGPTESTNYATSRNIYSSSTQLSQSQSISYSVVNGAVVWSNSTISDGTTVREYLDYSFQTYKGTAKVYDRDGTGALQRITETTSDADGRTNESAILSPTGALLTSSISAYDNWGNLIYSKDSVGQQAWYSYLNANSSSSFGSSGCTASFYTESVSGPIHDLMMGKCDFQNGSGSQQQETYYEYSEYGNLIEQKVSHNSGWLYTDYTYDSYGNKLSMKDANGHTTDYRYSSTYSSAYLTKTSILVGSQNVTTTYTYDLATGNMLSETDPNGQTTSYLYDALGRTTQVTYPAVGGVSAVAYTFYYDNNNTMKTIDPDGHVTKEYFDGLARLTEVQRWNGTSVYSAQYYTCNWLNAVASNETANQDVYTYSYDWNGNLVKVTNPDNSYVTTSYDYVHNTKTVTDERGHQTVYGYDWNQRLTSVEQYNSSTNYYLTQYSYDYSGNLLYSTDGKSQQTGYQYDDLNRLITTTFPTSPSTTEQRTYDNVGNLLTLKTANGSTITYTYDALNRLNKTAYPGTGGTITITYDADSNRLSVVNPSATDYYTYDAMDRLTNQTEYVGGTKYQTLYQYDKASNVVQIAYPDGYVLSMTYDAVNRLKTEGSFATVHYTVDDRINTITFGNGEVTTYTYNTRDWPTQIVDKYQGTKEMDLNYTYDGAGNVLTLNTETYRYDWLNRLNYSSGPWGTITYAYDQVGNRVRMTQGSTTTVYCYGNYNRLSGYYTTTSCSSPSTAYTYDANGNTVTKTGGWTYSYNYANQLTKVVQSGTTIQLNTYDGSGNRVQQTTAASSYTYSYMGLNTIYDKNVTGSTTTVTKHFYADGLQVAKMVNGAVYYLHEDALGSVRLVATATVTIAFSSNYIPYGQSYGMSGKEVFMYTGKPYDSTTGLYYYGARYYDDSIGRFITQDSIPPPRSYAPSCGASCGSPARKPCGTSSATGCGSSRGSCTPASVTCLYAYASDNPERYVDQTGHDCYESTVLECSLILVVATVTICLVGIFIPIVGWAACAVAATITITIGWDFVCNLVAYYSCGG